MVQFDSDQVQMIKSKDSGFHRLCINKQPQVKCRSPVELAHRILISTVSQPHLPAVTQLPLTHGSFTEMDHGLTA